MGAPPHFFYSLLLILLIQIVVSQPPTEGKSLMMRKLKTGIRDALWTLLGGQTLKQPLQAADVGCHQEQQKGRQAITDLWGTIHQEVFLLNIWLPYTESEFCSTYTVRTNGQWLFKISEMHSSKEAPLNSEGHQNSPFNLPPRSFLDTAKSRPKRRTWERPEERECRLRSLLVHIKDLGLGYNSEETILFKYCSGSCPKARSNHDLTLSILLQKSEIPALGDPCCRPTHYENVAFLDDSNQWHEVEKLSASACSCVG